jgi:hypothetical protein
MTFLPTLLNTLYLSVGVAILNNLPWQFIFIYTGPFGIRLYTLTKKEECKKIQKKIGMNTSQLSDNKKGIGYSIGYWYIMHIDIMVGDEGDRYKISFIATETTYNNLIKDDEEDDKDDTFNDFISNKIIITDKPKKNINIWECFGNFHNRWYRKRTIKIPNFLPLGHQIPVIDKIIEQYNKTKHVTAFIHGPPGSGKSIIGLLLTIHFSSSYCKALKLWKPGETLSNLHSEVDPMEDKPLIILLNEIDIPLINITEGIPDHKNLDISIQDKSGWNDLFDDIQIGMYPNIIVLLTSNKSTTFINELDPSYLRDSRIDIISELKHN